jgi:hypothetical protein
MLLISLACDAIALGSNQVEVEVEGGSSGTGTDHSSLTILISPPSFTELVTLP